MRVYLRIFFIFVLVSFKVAVSMASDLGQAKDCLKKYHLTAAKDNTNFQYTEQNISESEENEEDLQDSFISSDIITDNYFYNLFTNPLVAEQNRKINNIFLQKYPSNQQLFVLFNNFRI